MWGWLQSGLARSLKPWAPVVVSGILGSPLL